jgi:hypothetical protein
LPPLEFWFSLPTLLSVGGTLGAIALSFVPHKIWRVCGMCVLAFLVWWPIAITEANKAKPERDYVYFFVHPDQALDKDGNVLLFWRATGILDQVKFCFVRTADYPAYLNPICKGADFQDDAQPLGYLPLDDWTIDIDPKTRLGKVRERLNIVQNNGKVYVAFIQVVRKETGEILCENPARGGIKQCF